MELELSKDGTIAIIMFQEKTQNNDIGIQNIILFLHDVLRLSNLRRLQLYQGDHVSKQMGQTNAIRASFKKLVRFQKKDPELDKLIFFIRKGKLEKIKTNLKGEDLDLDACRDFTQLLLKFYPQSMYWFLLEQK